MGIRAGRERGQVLVLFAITATSILAVVGLLYSFGLILAQRRTLQTAADAASLRGSWQVLDELSSDNLVDANVLSTITTFALANGAPAGGTSAFYVDATGVGTPSAGAPKIVGSGSPVPFLARGVQVTVSGSVPIILNGLVKFGQTSIADRATSVSTARPTVSPAALQVMPIGVSSADMRAAFVNHVTYNLFAHNLAGNQSPTLNLASVAPPAPSYGPPATNEQDWSDGAHSGAWTLPMPLPTTVNLALGPGTASTTETGTTATYAVTNTLQPGETVTVTGCSVGGYNGPNLVVASATGSSFTVNLATAGLAAGTGAFVDVTYDDSIAAGLHLSIARQNLTDLTSHTYGLVLVPIYDPTAPTTSSLSIVGFAQLKIRDTDVTPTQAIGTFVPYATAAYGTLTVPTTDFGAALVSIVS